MADVILCGDQTKQISRSSRCKKQLVVPDGWAGGEPGTMPRRKQQEAPLHCTLYSVIGGPQYSGPTGRDVYLTSSPIYVIIIWFPFDAEQETVCKNQDRHESFEVQMLNNVVDKSLKLRIFRLQR